MGQGSGLPGWVPGLQDPPGHGTLPHPTLAHMVFPSLCLAQSIAKIGTQGNREVLGIEPPAVTGAGKTHSKPGTVISSL